MRCVYSNQFGLNQICVGCIVREERAKSALVEAMVLHSVDDKDAAESHLKHAEQAIGKEFHVVDGKCAALGVRWLDWIIYDTLRREALRLFTDDEDEPETALAIAEKYPRRLLVSCHQPAQLCSQLERAIHA